MRRDGGTPPMIEALEAGRIAHSVQDTPTLLEPVLAPGHRFFSNQTAGPGRTRGSSTRHRLPRLLYAPTSEAGRMAAHNADTRSTSDLKASSPSGPEASTRSQTTSPVPEFESR